MWKGSYKLTHSRIIADSFYPLVFVKDDPNKCQRNQPIKPRETPELWDSSLDSYDGRMSSMLDRSQSSQEDHPSGLLSPLEDRVRTSSLPGDEHSSLEPLKRRYQEYLAADVDHEDQMRTVLDAVDTDELDETDLETCIESRRQDCDVQARLCAACREAFANWADFPNLRPRCWWQFHPVFPNRYLIGSPGQAEDGTWTSHNRDVLETYGLAIWRGGHRDPRRVARPNCDTLQLEAAAYQGCKFCAFLLQRLIDANVLARFRKVEARLSQLCVHSSYSLELQDIRDHGPSRDDGSQILWLDLPGKPSYHCDNYIARLTCFESEVQTEPSTPEVWPTDAIELAAKWLNRCEKSHALCRVEASPASLPSRLISVASVPRLISTSCHPGPFRYATLSHCWGPGEFLKLTKVRVAAFMSEMPFESLGATFRDALILAQRLDIRYLWIDALCIVQDDNSDWESQAASMAAIYGGSCLNIAASSAVDNTDGFLHNNLELPTSVEVRTNWRGRPYLRTFFTNGLRHVYTVSSHLSTRAWTLQEKVLAPRTLHLGDRGTYWECRENTAATHIPDVWNPAGLLTSRGDLVRRFVLNDAQFSSSWSWKRTVQQYSGMSLTFGKDKLPALSGIARHHQKETQDQYLAGMWRADLREALCWLILEEPRELPEWRAPSWSWASIDGRVAFPYLRSADGERKSNYSDLYIEVFDADVACAGQDPFGQVAAGSLRLQCNFVLAGLMERDEPGNRMTAHVTYGIEKLIFNLVMDYSDSQETAQGTPVYLLPVHGGTRYIDKLSYYADDRVEVFDILGLVLISSGAVLGQFFRVGTFTTQGIGWDNLDLPESADSWDVHRTVLRLLTGYGRAQAELVCQFMHPGKDGEAQYVLEIV